MVAVEEVVRVAAVAVEKAAEETAEMVAAVQMGLLREIL